MARAGAPDPQGSAKCNVLLGHTDGAPLELTRTGGLHPYHDAEGRPKHA